MNIMNSPSHGSSPTYKHLKHKLKQSPAELKEKMRKNYKDKLHNCRNMLINKFRGTITETDLRETLNEIYRNMFNFSEDSDFEHEYELLEAIQNELVQEELDWWQQEYEKSQMNDVDWSAIENDDNVICPICQRSNLALKTSTLSCPNCKISLNTTKSMPEIKQSLMYSIDKHNTTCKHNVQFTVIPEAKDVHIYLICEACSDMQCVT